MIMVKRVEVFLLVSLFGMSNHFLKIKTILKTHFIDVFKHFADDFV